MVGLVAADVEIAVADLAVVFLADGVVALADVGRDVHVFGQVGDRQIDGVDRGADLGIVGHGEQRLVDLDVAATGLDQHVEVVAQQLARVGHHVGDIAVMLVVGDLAQHVRSGHGDLDRLVRQRRDGLEFVDQAQVDGVQDRTATGRGGMEDVGVVRRDRLGFRAALEGADLLPEVVQHGVGRRVAVVRAAVHLAAGHDVDAGQLLVEHGGLGAAVLRVGHGREPELAHGNQAVERLVPVRHAMRADHGRRVSWIPGHCRRSPPAGRL